VHKRDRLAGIEEQAWDRNQTGDTGICPTKVAKTKSHNKIQPWGFFHIEHIVTRV
jgi:hypothetical protein